MRNLEDVGVDVKVTVFLGPPGSGKGTQAKRLSLSGISEHISTGDVFRNAIKAGDDLGKSLKSYLDSGNLVPDDLTLDILNREIHKLNGHASSVVLDGYPRNVEQAEALEAQKDFEIEHAIYFDIPREVLLSRLSGRRICKECGETYNIRYSPPKKQGRCDKCKGELYQRPDDREDIVEKRLSIYEQQTSPLLEYYRNQGKLRTLHANHPVEQVQKELNRILS